MRGYVLIKATVLFFYALFYGIFYHVKYFIFK